MRMQVCPECYKEFYISNGWCFICPHCGYIFTERRAAERVKGELDAVLDVKGNVIRARTTNYTDRGAGIVYSGGFLEADTLMEITIRGKAARKAAAVWSKKVSRSVYSAGIVFKKSHGGVSQ